MHTLPSLEGALKLSKHHRCEANGCIGLLYQTWVICETAALSMQVPTEGTPSSTLLRLLKSSSKQSCTPVCWRPTPCGWVSHLRVGLPEHQHLCMGSPPSS